MNETKDLLFGEEEGGLLPFIHPDYFRKIILDASKQSTIFVGTLNLRLG